MERVIEKEVALSKVFVQLASVRLGAVEEFKRPTPGYYVCQRLSDDHAPMRIGNLSAGEAFPRVRSVGFLPPGRTVRVYPMEKPFRALICVFDKTHFEDMTEIRQELWDEYADALVSIRNVRLEIMMQAIYSELVQPEFGHDLLIESASNFILVEIARYGRSLDHSGVKNGIGQGLAPWQVRRIQERVQASLTIGYPNLSELAQLCRISQSHLMRNFKASTGWQIHKYVAEERLRAAKQMLASGHLSSKEISARLGFRSSAYFATAFRRMTGKTPMEYRMHVRAMELGRP